MRVRTESKRESILAIASKLFLELGFERTSMDLVAKNVGGSKATLYGYFKSKDLLFVEVTRFIGEQHLVEAVSELSSGTEDLVSALTRFGAKYLGFVTADFAIATRRMVVAESGRSDIGQRFFSVGPLRSFQIVSAFLAQAMDSKRLQSADIRLATSQLIALLEAESMPLLMLGFPMKLSQADRQDQATRAVQAFMLIYGNSSAGNRQSKLTPRATLDCP